MQAGFMDRSIEMSVQMPHLQEAGDVAAIDARAHRAFLALLPLAAAVHAPSCLLEV